METEEKMKDSSQPTTNVRCNVKTKKGFMTPSKETLISYGQTTDEPQDIAVGITISEKAGFSAWES